MESDSESQFDTPEFYRSAIAGVKRSLDDSPKSLKKAKKNESEDEEESEDEGTENESFEEEGESDGEEGESDGEEDESDGEEDYESDEEYDSDESEDDDLEDKQKMMDAIDNHMGDKAYGTPYDYKSPLDDLSYTELKELDEENARIDAILEEERRKQQEEMDELFKPKKQKSVKPRKAPAKTNAPKSGGSVVVVGRAQ